MRYLAEPFALGALRRGRRVEQFLGPVSAAGRSGIRYVEVRPAGGRYEVFLHTAEDVAHESFVDLYAFPPLHPEDEEEDFGRLVVTADDPLAALGAAEDRTGAVRERWVNAGVVQDEYADFVRAGHPPHRPAPKA
ncbi:MULTISPECIES: hypothetical protein [unclassified Streptomyces]|uniref:hypothetical protein n=1 Tax=unclassified Streptomyces TaxID=2593676 RepID=UPI002DDC29F7|nr:MULTISPECIES: hypothetical protein [unclassified Streptomyces]WSA96233.1 hypothetical protein OIE63_35240 [Streptomyces sp. NBC_01795]WSB80646.1 hypothetical protein OHB04_36345 [Streptomyces sp. NBC_01775]WSS11144.1 hypothetical protein OG533_03905 [Streptomyces sp. NBC_01186]WSS39854.1 hypothetical protein OG220_04005 [Streptomyces sp. NBC_01187]